MIIKNLLPEYNNRLLSSLISSFGELCDCVTRIEDTINNGQLEKMENKPPIKKTYGGGVTTSKAPNPVNVSSIMPQQPLAYLSFIKKTHQEFSDLGMTLPQAYENLASNGFLNLYIPHRCLIPYLLLGNSMTIATSIRNLAIKPTITFTLSMRYKI